MRRLILVLILALVAPGARHNAPKAQAQDAAAKVDGAIRFEEIAQKAGLHYITANGNTENKNQPQTMVAGVALFDYDGDGYLDIYLVGGAAIPSLQKESPAYWNRLFHNNHDGTFTDVTEKAGLAGAGYGMGVAVGDYDNDGRPDVFLANVTGNQLFHNNGDGTFTDVTAKAGVAGAQLNGQKMWSVGAGWFDYNNDGLLDLFVVNYCVWEVNKDPYCAHERRRTRLLPSQVLRCQLHNTLYRNNGDGTFTDVSDETGIAQHVWQRHERRLRGLRRRRLSRCLRRQRYHSRIFSFTTWQERNSKKSRARGRGAIAPDGIALSGMGSDFRDVNNDGLPDIWHTAVEHEGFPLWLNRAKANSRI